MSKTSPRRSSCGYKSRVQAMFSLLPGTTISIQDDQMLLLGLGLVMLNISDAFWDKMSNETFSPPT